MTILKDARLNERPKKRQVILQQVGQRSEGERTSLVQPDGWLKAPGHGSRKGGVFLPVHSYEILAGAVLALHLLFILWVILGALLTRRHRLLGWVHIVSLVYGIGIEVGPWPCPLTFAEQWLQGRAGITPYRESFLVHYLEALVYPDVPQGLLVWCAAAVCVFNLGIYAWRFWRSSRRVD